MMVANDNDGPSQAEMHFAEAVAKLLQGAAGMPVDAVLRGFVVGQTIAITESLPPERWDGITETVAATLRQNIAALRARRQN